MTLFALLDSLYDRVKGAWEDRFERSYGFGRGLVDEVVAGGASAPAHGAHRVLKRSWRKIAVHVGLGRYSSALIPWPVATTLRPENRMTNRARDWLAQADRDLEQALASRDQGRHEWSCFAAHQAAENAVKALHLTRDQEAWGHVVARLLRELPVACPPDLIEQAKVLDFARSQMA